MNGANYFVVADAISGFTFRSLIKLSHNLPYTFWQVLVAASTIVSLQRKRGIANETLGSPGMNERSM